MNSDWCVKRLEKMTARAVKTPAEPSCGLQSSLLKSNLRWLTITSMNPQSMCDGRLNEDSVAGVTSALRFLLSCDSAVVFLNLFTSKISIIHHLSMEMMDGLGVRIKAREEAHTLNHLMVLSLWEGFKVIQKLQKFTPETLFRWKSSGCKECFLSTQLAQLCHCTELERLPRVCDCAVVCVLCFTW